MCPEDQEAEAASENIRPEDIILTPPSLPSPKIETIPTEPKVVCERIPGTNSIDCHRTDYGPALPTTDGMPEWLTKDPPAVRVLPPR
jgi:hypothetical protein